MACACGEGKKIIITACSGASNVGLLADRVARGLRESLVGSMTCLSALGAAVPNYIETAKTADLNVVIDGCPVSCGKKIFDGLGIPVTQIMMTDYGAEKGKTEITDALVSGIVDRVIADLGAMGA